MYPYIRTLHLCDNVVDVVVVMRNDIISEIVDLIVTSC